MNPHATAACKQPPGVIAPSVDFARCEGKADCVVVCPENVFEIRRIEAADYQKLRPLQRLKLRVHGMKVAYAPRADACRACSLCASACPEHAITLVRMRQTAVPHGARGNEHAEPARTGHADADPQRA